MPLKIVAQKRGFAHIDREFQRLTATVEFQQDCDAQNHPEAIFQAATSYANAESASDSVPSSWPWLPEAWCPKDRATNLAHAGALCLIAGAVAERKKYPAALITEFRFYANRLAVSIDKLS